MLHCGVLHLMDSTCLNYQNIGKLIQKAYNHSSIVKVEEGDETEDKLIKPITSDVSNKPNPIAKMLSQSLGPFAEVIEG